MQMKSQLNQMMLSLKQKDDIITQQNQKLSQFGNPNPAMGFNFNTQNQAPLMPPSQGNMYGINPNVNSYNQNFLAK